MRDKILTHKSEFFIYTSIQAIIWAGNGLKTPSNIELNTGKILSEILDDTEDDLCLIVDFKGVIQKIDHALKPFFMALSVCDKEVIFINHSNIEDKLHSYIIELVMPKRPVFDFSSNIKHFKNKHNDFSKHIAYSDIQKRIDTLLASYVNNSVKNSFLPFKDGPNLLPATALKATGIFNAALIIAEPKKFLWTCLLMAQLVERLKERIKEPIKILTVSQYASTFALTVGLLTELETDIIDQIGPEVRIYNQDELDNIRYSDVLYNYVYVGDFTIGGTEIKVAKAYAESFQCSLDYAVVIGTLFNAEVYKDNFQLNCLVELDGLLDQAKYALNLKSTIKL